MAIITALMLVGPAMFKKPVLPRIITTGGTKPAYAARNANHCLRIRAAKSSTSMRVTEGEDSWSVEHDIGNHEFVAIIQPRPQAISINEGAVELEKIKQNNQKSQKDCHL